MAVGDIITGETGYHFNEVFAWVPNQVGISSALMPSQPTQLQVFYTPSSCKGVDLLTCTPYNSITL